MGETIPHHLQGLSSDAKAVAGGHFGFMKTGGASYLKFNTPRRITGRTKDALVELEEAGVIRHEAVGTPWVYAPLMDRRPFARWLMENPDAGKFPAVSEAQSDPSPRREGRTEP